MSEILYLAATYTSSYTLSINSVQSPIRKLKNLLIYYPRRKLDHRFFPGSFAIIKSKRNFQNASVKQIAHAFEFDPII